MAALWHYYYSCWVLKDGYMSPYPVDLIPRLGAPSEKNVSISFMSPSFPLCLQEGLLPALGGWWAWHIFGVLVVLHESIARELWLREEGRDGVQSLMAAVAAHRLSRWHWRKQQLPWSWSAARNLHGEAAAKVSGTARPTPQAFCNGKEFLFMLL